MSDQEKIKRLEAQIQVALNSIRNLKKLNNTLTLKASKWEIAKACGITMKEVKSKLDGMKIEGLTLEHLKTFTSIKDMVDDFDREYGGQL